LLLGQRADGVSRRSAPVDVRSLRARVTGNTRLNRENPGNKDESALKIDNKAFEIMGLRPSISAALREAAGSAFRLAHLSPRMRHGLPAIEARYIGQRNIGVRPHAASL